MSGRVKVPSIEEIMAKRKAKKAKAAEIVASQEAETLKEASALVASKSLQQQISESDQSRKRKALFDLEEDPQHVVIRIPHGTAILSDPSGLEPFVDRLLLEEDEQRLNELGLVESSRRLIAHQYQALECSIFQQKALESLQRRLKDSERSISKLKRDVVASEHRAKEQDARARAAEATLKVEREMLELENTSLKEALAAVEGREKCLLDEKAGLEEQMESIALEAMVKERANLMKQYVAGEHGAWTPNKWIKMHARLEAGLLSEEEEDEEEECSLEVIPPEVEPAIATEVDGDGRKGEGTVESDLPSETEAADAGVGASEKQEETSSRLNEGGDGDQTNTAVA